MTDEHDSIEKLLDSISKDEPIHWDLATRDASPEDRSRVETLREIIGIQSFNRVLQRHRDQRRSQRGPADIPESWGDLLVLEWIGSGARAHVYRAWDQALQRDVALKLYLPGVIGRADGSLPEQRRVAASIQHPNLIACHGIDHRDGRLGVWMELQRGTTLEQQVYSRGPLPPSEVAKLGMEIGAALVVVHDAGVLHRSIKPANVIQANENRSMLAEIDVTGTQASEQSDLHALGLVLWFAAAGQHPFTLGAAGDRIPAPVLSELRPEFPPALAGIIAAAIGPSVGGGFENPQQLVDALAAWRSDATRRDPANSTVAKRTSAVARLAAFVASLGSRGRGGRK